MAKTFRMTNARRLEGRFTAFLVRRGLAPSSMYVLSVPGRKTGIVRSNPVDHVVLGGRRYIVAAYGLVQWVHNVRAAGQVVLSRGGRSEALQAVEVSPQEAAPVLKAYVARGSLTRPYFDAKPDSPLEDFIPEAKRHPVFRVSKASQLE